MSNNRISKATTISRRDFLKGSAIVTGAAIAWPTIVPSSVFGADAPSNRITMAIVGCGNQGSGELGAWLGDDRVQVVAVCDGNRESAGYWDGTVRGWAPARQRVEADLGSDEAEVAMTS